MMVTHSTRDNICDRASEMPLKTSDYSADGDALTITDERGEVLAKFKRVYISHWWVWAEE